MWYYNKSKVFGSHCVCDFECLGLQDDCRNDDLKVNGQAWLQMAT
jgi:hypothetical protein